MNKYEEHVKTREEQVKKLFPSVVVNNTITMDNPYNYRHKVVGTFAYKDKKLICGQYLPKTHKVQVTGRELQHPVANKIMDTVCTIGGQMRYQAYNEKTRQGLLRHIMIRVGYNTGEIMVILVIGATDLPGKKEFAKRLVKDHPEITTLVLNVNTKDTTMVLGDRNMVQFGPGFIFDSIENIKFKLSPLSFYQVNPSQMIKLYGKAIEMADIKERDLVLDVFCGIGSLTLLMAKKAKKVVGVELNKDAIMDAKGNSKYNKVSNATFFCQDATKWMASQSETVDVVMLDPPRSGCTPSFLKSLSKLNPPKIVYISCNPETLRDDVKILEKEGYQLKEVQPVDMFPFTQHIEAVGLLTRIEGTK